MHVLSVVLRGDERRVPQLLRRVGRPPPPAGLTDNIPVSMPPVRSATPGRRRSGCDRVSPSRAKGAHHMSTTLEVLDRHLKALEAGDLAALMDDYADDAVMIVGP